MSLSAPIMCVSTCVCVVYPSDPLSDVSVYELKSLSVSLMVQAGDSIKRLGTIVHYINTVELN